MNPILNTLMPIKKENVDSLIIPPPKDNNDVAFVFDNFLRDELTFNLIKSICETYPGSKLYVADQSIYDETTMYLYDKLIKYKHSVTFCGFDCGISVARNSAINNVKEPFIFLCDCDNLINQSLNLDVMKTILINNIDVGFCGLYELFNEKINHYEHFLKLNNNIIIYETIPSNSIIRNQPFFFCDYVMNAGLIKREVFDTVKYEESAKICEHLDFFMQLKYKTNWKVACSTQSFLTNQNLQTTNETYKQFRGRNKIYWDFYIQKWGIKQINNYDLVRKIIIGK